MIIPTNASAAYSLPGILPLLTNTIQINIPKKNSSDLLSSDVVMDYICTYFNTNEKNVQSKSSKHHVAYHRQIATYFLYHFTWMRKVDISKRLNRSRYCISYSRDKVIEQLESKFDNDYKKDVAAICSLFPTLIKTKK